MAKGTYSFNRVTFQENVTRFLYISGRFENKLTQYNDTIYPAACQKTGRRKHISD